MKKNFLFTIFILFLAGSLLLACTRDENEAEPGAIEKFTDETAEEIVNSIKTPLNNAHSARDIGEDRMQDIDDAVKESSSN